MISFEAVRFFILYHIYPRFINSLLAIPLTYKHPNFNLEAPKCPNRIPPKDRKAQSRKENENGKNPPPDAHKSFINHALIMIHPIISCHIPHRREKINRTQTTREKKGGKKKTFLKSMMPSHYNLHRKRLTRIFLLPS